MQWMLTLMLVVQLLSALVMIGLVLIQHGKGADMGASFGSGASGSLFGATGSANFLSRSTAVCAALFFCCTLALAHFSNDRSQASPGTSVLDRRVRLRRFRAAGLRSPRLQCLRPRRPHRPHRPPRPFPPSR
jgi:preprotein translocase subunit SecG